MSDGPFAGSPSHREGEPAEPVVIRDKRRFDPQTGERRAGGQGDDVSTAASGEQPGTSGGQTSGGPDVGSDGGFGGAVGDDLPGRQDETPSQAEHPDTVLARERLEDVRRVQAEYVNYKRRVDRDRETQRDAQTARIVESLLPVLDDVHLAREHGDLAGSPFEKIADKLQTTLERHGLSTFGEPGEAFDPAQHEALMRVEAPVPDGATGATVVQVMQPGYRIGERVVRPARVAVADPQ